MANQFASHKHAVAICDRCGFRYDRTELRALTIKGKLTNILVCPPCWEPDHPQLRVGERPVVDPEAIRNPRPDTTYQQSRNTQWGWNPVGLSDPFGLRNVDSALEGTGAVGTVTVTVT